jgi:energy-coupling factor transporter ATP-binding protein EcfA2
MPAMIDLPRVLQGIITMGEELKGNQARTDRFEKALHTVESALDWKHDPLNDWIRRVVPRVNHSLTQTTLASLLQTVHGFLTNRPLVLAQQSIRLGQVAWDLKDDMEKNTSLQPDLQSALRAVWSRRPEAPQLREVSIENFRCLKSMRVPLRRLTVLIGQNDSGKSAFLRAIQILVEEMPIQLSDRWMQDPRMSVTLSGDSTVGRGTVSTQGNTGSVPELKPVGFYQLPSQGASMESPGQREDQGPPTISPNGQGVPGLLDYLLRQERERFFAARDAIQELVPGVVDINISTPVAETRRLDLLIQGGLRLPADLASTGVRLLLVFVALAYHPNPPKIILLEEPETGVHPRKLGDIMRLLREITQGAHGGQAAQVILTTHSPYLLDLVDPTEDQVLVFRRNEDGSCTAEPADESRLQLFLDEFQLGEVWYNQGEEGLVTKKG